ncbi:MAG: class III extradiol ring-cleavage dioxygenase [Paenibacillaceae bacterium]
MMPTLFINHGAPTLALVESDYSNFLRQTGERLKPKAIVMFSAHWEARITTLSFADGPLETIYDFGGFPDELYRMTYPAQGSPMLAGWLENKFKQHEIPTQRDDERGLDHGSWVFLRYMFPEANIPIVSISVNPFLTPAEQYKIGEALRGIGKEDILVIGSGTTVHNFNEIKFGQATPEPWAVEFDDWIAEKIVNQDVESLLQYEQLAPHARRAVPRAEHFVPLFHAMASSPGTKKPQVLWRGYDYGTFSYSCFEF